MANPFTVQPLGGLQNMQMIGQGMQGIAQNVQQGREEERRQALMQQASEVMERGNPQEIAQFRMQNPEIGEAMTSGIKFADEITQKNLQESMQRIMAGEDPAQVISDRATLVESRGGDASDTRREAQMLEQMGPEAYREMVSNIYQMRYGTEGVPGATGDTPAATRQFNTLVEASKSDDPVVRQAARIELGLEPRAGTLSADQRTALNDYLRDRVVGFEAERAGAREEGKLETQRELIPGIRGAIKTAEQQAQSRGEAVSEYERAQAAMPGLQEVVDKLMTLSDVATYTMGGKVFDTLSRELGFGATEGATARAKMESLVNNQILPLLRDTFGAQFTEREGESLKRTMLDIDAPPSAKKEILQSFIEQKMRDLEMKRGRAEEATGQTQMSEEEADAFINQMLEQ